MSNLEQPHTRPPVEHRILRLDEVQTKTGFKRAHLYTLMHKGEFPEPCDWGRARWAGTAAAVAGAIAGG